MKLKKIVSLALAGILAVSMLTACGDKGSSSSSSEPTTPAAGISDKIEAMLNAKDVIDLADSTAMDAILSASIEDANLKAATMASSGLAAVQKALNTNMKSKVVNYKSASVPTFTSAVTLAKANYTSDGVYAYAAAFTGDMSEEVVLSQVASALNTHFFTTGTAGNLLETVSTNGKIYDCEYTGSISMQKVTDGSVSQWYVLVVLDIDSTESTPTSKR